MTVPTLKILGRNPRVLIVDDEPEILTATSFILKNYGCDVATASDGKEAHNKFQTQDFDVILCDIRMPHLDGMDFMTKTRNIGFETPVIFITGFADVAMVTRALRLGAIDYIEKPVARDRLIAIMHRVLEVEARRQEARDIVLQLTVGHETQAQRLEALQRQINMIRAMSARTAS